jgi:DNA-binding CsgD family transcriptional regulator
LPGKTGLSLSKLFLTRDELSFRNIRGRLWPGLLVFPLAVIMGNLRFYNHSVALAGYETHMLMFLFLGLGWLIAAVLPEKGVIHCLRFTVLLSTALLLLQFFMPLGFWQFALYMALQFLNTLSAACAFYLFCFMLNNVERLFGMALIQLYYCLYYIAWTAFSFMHTIGNTWGSAIMMALFLSVVFLLKTKQQDIRTESNGKGSGVPFVIGLGVVHYMIMCMNNYIEWTANSVSIMAFGLGTGIAVILVIFMQLLKGRNAMYIWLLFLVLSLLGLGLMLFDMPVTFLSGSFIYGLGDSLGYIIICYICAGAIKQSKSLRMFRLYCFVLFIEYCIISGLFSVYFNYFESPNRLLAFGVVLVLVSLCLMFMPLIQKRLFEADWTDGLYLRDMEEYSQPFAETEDLNTKAQLDLTSREEEIFTMLLKGAAPKEIGFTLKISYDTVRFHQKNLYRKLGIQSRAELFAKYLNQRTENNEK